MHVSCGWDNTLIIYDVRQHYPVASMLGPHVCGESLDVQGNYILAGSYSLKENLTIWDIRKHSRVQTIDWFDHDFEKDVDNLACLVYGASFSKTSNDFCIAGGTQKNEVRVFQNTGTNYRCVAALTDLEKAVLSVDYSNKSNKFAIGSGDGYLRIMEIGKASLS